jgi:hypothetical protein
MSASTKLSSHFKLSSSPWWRAALLQQMQTVLVAGLTGVSHKQVFMHNENPLIPQLNIKEGHLTNSRNVA